jgi:xylulokinase
VSLLLGCDVGSQGLKALVLDPERGVLADAYRGYDLEHPKPGWAEQDPALWQEAFRDAVAEAMASARAAPEDLAALAFASQVDGLVPCDGGFRPVRPAIIWMDRRAARQCDAIGERIQPGEILRVTGLNLDPSHVAPKALWLRETEPELFDRAEHLLLPGAFMVAWLTGESVVDHSNASSSMLLDVTERAWSSRMFEALDLDPTPFGRVAAATEVAGTLLPERAEALGLPPGLPVAVGCGDEHGACVGVGVLGPGPVCDIAGTAEPVAAGAEEAIFDETGLIETHCHADPRYWLIENPGFVSGGSMRWLREVLGEEGYEAMAGEAGAAEPGSGGVWFLPCLSGAMTPTWDADARGVFSGLSLATGRGELTRAVMEGCAYALRDLVDRIADLGLPAEEIRTVGGGARSELWCQIKADVTGRPVWVPAVTETTALGAAMLAGDAVGTWTLEEAADGLVRQARVHEPDGKAVEGYADRYAVYRDLYDRLTPVFRRAGRIEGRSG